MNVKPTNRPGEVIMKVGPGDSTLLSKTGLLSIQKIMVPTDFSDVSVKAMDYALAFAQQFSAEVLAIYVVDDIPIFTGEAPIVPVETGLPQMKSYAERKIAELAAGKRGANRQIQTMVRTGSAPHEIVEAAKEHQIDLIIMATHGRRGINRFFLGSTTERVVRHAPCPVMVVREKERGILSSET